MRIRLVFRVFLAFVLLAFSFFALHQFRTGNSSTNPPPAETTRAQAAVRTDRHESIPSMPKSRADDELPNSIPSPSIIASGWTNTSQSELDAFARWADRFLQADEQERMQLTSRGIELAKERRSTLKQLIETDPERALAAAVPIAVRKQLPTPIVDLLEERISGKGELSLNAVTPAPGQTVTDPTFRSALIDGHEYRAYTYGHRAQLATLPNASINGIAIDHSLAVSDSPLRLLEPGETADGRPVENVCPISGIVTPASIDTLSELPGPTAVEVGGKIQILCHPDHVTLYETRLAAGEHPNELNEADGQPGSSGIAGRPTQAWTHGTKTVLIIRVDFSDLPGTPVNPADSQAITEDYVVNRINSSNGVRDFYIQGSYSQTSLQISPTVAGDSPDVTGVLRMPQTANFYATSGNNSLLHSDARALAQAAGFAVNSYDRVGVVFPNVSGISGSQITYAGLANIIGANFWINGYYEFSVVAHELGHTYGLRHANIWQVSDGNPVSPAGTSVEYGDVFDVMGNGLNFENHFSHLAKSILQWIPDTSVTTITSNGTYRVYRFDHSGANLTNTLALKIVRDSIRDYWIGYRRATANANLDNGAYVLWGYNVSQASDLLDMNTPNSNPNDAALAIGATFNDSVDGVTIHPTAQGGSGADEWLDVQVTFQPRIQWAKTTVYADEGSGNATLTLTRNNSASGTVTIHYSTTNNTATAPADFAAQSGDITWTDGDMSTKTINIPIVADGTPEGTEKFVVGLSNPTGGVIVNNSTATVFITEPGTFDPEFNPFFVNNTVNRVLALPDGRVLAAGWFSLIQDASFKVYTNRGITQFTATGGVDTNFLTDGGGITAPSAARVEDVARQPDGKLVIVGNFTAVTGTSRNNIARLNADGRLDASFNPGTGANDIINAVVVQPDGKILIGGDFTTFNGTAREYVARLNSDGSLDTSFVGPDFADLGGWSVLSLALQPDRKLLIGGVFYFSGGANFKGGICRVTTNGTLDATFNGVAQGAHVLGDPSTLAPITRIVPQIDGKILVAGQFTAFNNTARSGIARLTNTGALDTFAPTTDGDCSAILIQPDGKILLGGTFTTVNGAAAQNFARVTSAGASDSTFAASSGPSTPVYDFALQPDGRILFGGAYGNFQGHNGPLWRFFSGIPALPGTIQWSSDLFTGIEGTNATLTVTRVGGTAGPLSVNFATVSGTATNADFTGTNGTLSWLDGDATARTISIPITADGVAEGPESFVINLGAPLMNSASLGAAQQATVNIYTGFGAWQVLNFSPAELGNSLISGDTADPDGDGIKNIFEYAFGLPPKTPDNSGLPTGAIQNISGTNFLTMIFRRRVPAFDLVYTPRTAASVTNTWTANAVQVGVPVNNGDGTETVTYRDSVPALPTTSQRFMRLDIQRVP
jgi:uncharacterized delta-60 repeat protein